MQNRDVIFVSNALANGGAARVLCLLANEFSSRGLEVGISAFMPYEGEFPVREAVVKEYSPHIGSSPATRAKRLRWIRGIVKRNPSAVIIAFEYFVNMEVLSACFGLPNRVIVSERNDPARVGSGFPADPIRKLLYRRATVLVCQTDEAASYFPETVRKEVILNPINPDLPQPALERRSVVVTFCRLEPQKNLPMLLRAFATFHEIHSEYTLEIYGRGKEGVALNALVNSLSLTDCVQILPPRSDIYDVVRECAMFVLPSDYEGFSNSMIEAMALGLPTICTDCPCGGARMVITNEQNGLLVPVGDTKALASAMARVADDPDFASRIGVAAEKLRECLAFDKIADDWLQIMTNGSRE